MEWISECAIVRPCNLNSQLLVKIQAFIQKSVHMHTHSPLFPESLKDRNALKISKIGIIPEADYWWELWMLISPNLWKIQNSPISMFPIKRFCKFLCTKLIFLANVIKLGLRPLKITFHGKLKRSVILVKCNVSKLLKVISLCDHSCIQIFQLYLPNYRKITGYDLIILLGNKISTNNIFLK